MVLCVLVDAIKRMSAPAERKHPAPLDDSLPPPTPSVIAISEQINLNVGGALFSTTVGSLRMQKDSFFDLMFSGRFPIAYDSEKRVFIDRDGTHFRHILNYLRQAGKGWTPEKLGLNKAELQQLRDEAEFYMLKPIVKLIDINLNERDGKNETVVYVCHETAAAIALAVQYCLADGFVLNSGSVRLPERFHKDDRMDPLENLFRDYTHNPWTALTGSHYPSEACISALKQLIDKKASFLVVMVASAGKVTAISRRNGPASETTYSVVD